MKVCVLKKFLRQHEDSLLKLHTDFFLCVCVFKYQFILIRRSDVSMRGWLEFSHMLNNGIFIHKPTLYGNVF